MAAAIIETEGLTKRYGNVAAVDGLSLQVPEGRIFGLLGPNGCGKTTTMGMLLGLVKPTSGRMKMFGQSLTRSVEPVLRRIGAIVETPAFYPHLTGRENLRYFQGIRPGTRNPGEIDELLELVGLSARADSRFRTYSLGMKQRLGLACTLIGRPELLFLDEPTNGLDPAGMVEVRGLIRRLGDAGHTVLISSHILNEVEQVCDSVAILAKGKLIAQGRVRDLLGQQSRFRLKTTNDARAFEILAALPWVSGLEQADGALWVSAQDASEIAAVLARHEVYPSELYPVQLSLEKYFLDVTAADSPAVPGTGA